MKKNLNRLLALILALAVTMSSGQTALAAEIVNDTEEVVSEIQGEEESANEMDEKTASAADDVLIEAQEGTEEVTVETPEDGEPAETEEQKLADDRTSVGVQMEGTSSYSLWPSSSSLSFTEDSYTGAIGEVVNITAVYVCEQEPTDFAWECLGKEAENAISFSSTSTMGPAETGKENTWWISVAATVVKEGNYTVKLTVKANSAWTATAEAKVTVTEAITSRYTVLILDTSGSMSDTPAQVQKEAAIKFCDYIVNASGNNYVAIVKLNTSSTVGCEFTTDLNTLTNYINGIPASGGTNMEQALTCSRDLLNSIPDKTGIIKNIVLCSDGLPESGSTSIEGPYTSSDHYYNYSYGNAVYNTATEIKKNGISLYTLGFFHSLSGVDFEFGKRLMSDIATSKDYYHEVTDADKLEFTFGEIAGDITVEPVSIYVSYSTYAPAMDGVVQYKISTTIVNNSKTTDLTNLFVNLDEGDNAEILTEHGEWMQKLDSLAAGKSIEFSWVISLNVAQVYPDGGAHSFIVYAGSDQTVVSSAQGTIAVSAVNGQSNELDFSTDVWNFHNFSDKNVHEDVINEDDKKALLSGLSPSDYAKITDYLEKEGKNGHCFGMSLTTILSKMNIFDVSDYGVKKVGLSYEPATCLREAEETDRIESILCYYQSLRELNSFTNDAQIFINKPVKEQLSILAKKADAVKLGGVPVLFAYQSVYQSKNQTKTFAHAVVAYATESGLWKKHGVTYNKRILIYDSNTAYDGLGVFNTIWDEDYCLYFNEDTEEWIIPGYYSYGLVSTNGKAYLQEACNDLTILNTHNYDDSLYNYTAELRAQNETALRLSNSESEYIIMGKSGSVTGDTDLVTYYDPESTGVESNISTLHVVLPDENDNYTLSTLSGKAEALDFYISDEDLFLSVEAAAAKGSAFSTDSEITLLDNIGSYELKIADDNIDEGKYNTYIVSGDNAGDVSIKLTGEGVLISGDDLTNMTVTGSDTVNEAKIDFSTNDDSVLVVADEDNSKLVVLVDTNDDGIYETNLADVNVKRDNNEVDNDSGDDNSTSSTTVVTIPSANNRSITTIPSKTDNSNSAATITVLSANNGSITVTPSDADKGDTVRIIVTPDKGYVLSKLTVTDAEGNVLTLIDNGDGTYSFIMPADNVVVDAAFETETQPELDEISGSNNNNSSDDSAKRTDSTMVTNPSVGDGVPVWLWVTVLFVGAIGLIVIIQVVKRKKLQNK